MLRNVAEGYGTLQNNKGLRGFAVTFEVKSCIIKGGHYA